MISAIGSFSRLREKAGMRAKSHKIQPAFPLYLMGDSQEHYGIPHGFSSRVALERYLQGVFGA